MKFIYKIFLVSLVIAIGACDTDLDLQQDPNAVAPENASINDLFNSIQLDFADAYNAAQAPGGRLARMYFMGNFTYQANTSPAAFNGLWQIAYADLFPDIDALLELTEANGLDVHSGAVKVMKAYVLMAMVDNIGNIPLNEAGQGTDLISPSADNGASVYAGAIALLDEAIAQLSGTSAAGPGNDFYYGGDASKWTRAANTLRLRAALTTRLVDPSAGATISSIVSSGNFISDASDDFQAQFGSQRTNPNSRHPLYNNHYELGDGDYLNNYYMWLLRADKTLDNGAPLVDPRIRYYFYRKVGESYGLDPTVYSCLQGIPDGLADTRFTPAHWEGINPRLNYCVAWEDGYYGRDHGNGSGIPPDGPVRTSYGLYPAGGSFDDNSFTDTRQNGTTGGLGAGIYPIMLSSFVDFMRAEAALTAGTGEDARALLESGIRKSIAKVQSFESLDAATIDRTVVDARTGEETNIREVFVPKAEDIDGYVNFVLAEFDGGDATAKLNAVMKEYYIALWGNGLEAYNLFRRTGMPLGIAPTEEADPGDFILSFFLPASHVNRNANATQKTLTERVFWDDGSANNY